MSYRLGCIPSKEDKRDLLIKAYLPKAEPLPKSIDYTDDMTEVGDQGAEGTCVGWACANGCKEYQEMIDYGERVRLSPRFLYDECKKLDGFPNEEGTSIAVAMKVLRNIGVCREIYYPYYGSMNNSIPIYKDANKYRILTYARISNLGELKASLVKFGPCVAGVEVFNGFMQTKNGYVPIPAVGEESLGGHAICIVGYNDDLEVVKFKNSWGKDWGEEGYGYLSYKYIDELMFDAWSLVDIDDTGEVEPEPVKKFDLVRILKWGFAGAMAILVLLTIFGVIHT